MPYYLRAKTYLRYAEEEFKKALERASEDEEAARRLFRDSFVLAAKAIWALSQVEAPKEKPSAEEIIKRMDSFVEPEVAEFFKKGWERLEEASTSELRTLVSKAIGLAKDVLSPVLGPKEWFRNL